MDVDANSDNIIRPDLEHVDATDCLAAEFPAPQACRDAIRVVVRQSVLNEIHAHGDGTTKVEVCGVLVGNIYRDDRGPFVWIRAAIRGAHAASQNAQVTFTADTWDHIHAELESVHHGEKILGWYHTHPGFGIFLSAMDRFIHDNFFNRDEQVAFVYDPLHREEGLFVWRTGTPILETFIIEPDLPAEGEPMTTITQSRNASCDRELTAAAGLEADSVLRLDAVERRQYWLTVALAAVFVIALGWPVALLRSGLFQTQPDRKPSAPTEVSEEEPATNNSSTGDLRATTEKAASP